MTHLSRRLDRLTRARLSGSVTGAAPGTTVLLTGTDDQGDAVSVSAPVSGDGSYSFTGLAAGTYTLTVVPPPGSQPSQATPGTVNGAADGLASSDNSQIGDITLGAGGSGVGYDFALWLPA